MAAPNKVCGKPTLQITVYNGTGSDIPEGTALAFDASYPPETYAAPGVKTTTGATDVIGFAYGAIKNGRTGSAVVSGVAVGIAGGTITFGTTLNLMTNSSGQVVAKTATNRGIGAPLSSAVSGGKVLVLMNSGADNA